MIAHAALIRISSCNFTLHELLHALLTHSEFPLGSTVECTLRKEKDALGVVCALQSKFLKAVVGSCLEIQPGVTEPPEVALHVWKYFFYHGGILQSDCVFATKLFQDVASVLAAASWFPKFAFH